MLRSSVTVQPRYAPLFGIPVQLPRDWEITSVTSAGKPLEWETVRTEATDPAADPPRQTIQIELSQPAEPRPVVGALAHCGTSSRGLAGAG